MSDLHLEFGENRKNIHNKLKSNNSEVLVLAGDVMYLNDQKDWFLDWCSNTFEMTYWIPGNHEFYGGEDMNKYLTCNIPVRENVFLVNNNVQEYKGIRFVLSTGWSSISPLNQLRIQVGMNDYRCMVLNDNKLTVPLMNDLSKESWNFISSELNEGIVQGFIGKQVAVTHYLPSFDLIAPMFVNDPLNEAFANHKEYLMCDAKIWVFGHSHYNQTKKIGNCISVSNTLGYIRYETVTDFSLIKTINI